MAALDAALATLPERQRQAVVLRHIEGMSNPEIAEVLEIGVEAVESLTARGKRALKQALDGRRRPWAMADDRRKDGADLDALFAEARQVTPERRSGGAGSGRCATPCRGAAPAPGGAAPGAGVRPPAVLDRGARRLGRVRRRDRGGDRGAGRGVLVARLVDVLSGGQIWSLSGGGFSPDLVELALETAMSDTPEPRSPGPHAKSAARGAASRSRWRCRWRSTCCGGPCRGAVLSRPDPGEAPAIRTLGLGPFALALPREARDDIRRSDRGRHGELRRNRAEIGRSLMAVRQALLADPSTARRRPVRWAGPARRRWRFRRRGTARFWTRWKA
jgi:hypothetical protein